MTTADTLTDGPIPPLPDLDDAPAVTTAEELRQRWRAIFGAEGFGRHSLWLTLFDGDGRQVPLIVPIDDIPDRLDPATIDGLVGLLSQMGDLADSVALALTRPGSTAITDLDRGRARDLLDGLHRATAEDRQPLRLWPLHLAVGARDQRRRSRLTPPATSDPPSAAHPVLSPRHGTGRSPVGGRRSRDGR